MVVRYNVLIKNLSSYRTYFKPGKVGTSHLRSVC